MAFMQKGHSWSTGYAIPEYVRAEPPGRGTFTTKWMPRGTIPGLVPDFLAKPAGQKLTGRDDVHLGMGDDVYELVPTGDSGGVAPMKPGSPGDPILQFGDAAAAHIMAGIQGLPESQRKSALMALLASFDPGMHTDVTDRMAKFEGKGMPPRAALHKALAIVFSNKLGAEIIAVGKSGKRPKSGLLALGGGQSSLGIFGSLGSALGKLKDTVTGMVCSVVSNPLAPAAGAGVAAASGVPPEVGAAGTGVASSMCASDSVPQVPPVPPKPATPAWVLPAAIGGGALLLIIALK